RGDHERLVARRRLHDRRVAREGNDADLHALTLLVDESARCRFCDFHVVWLHVLGERRSRDIDGQNDRALLARHRDHRLRLPIGARRPARLFRQYANLTIARTRSSSVRSTSTSTPARANVALSDSSRRLAACAKRSRKHWSPVFTRSCSPVLLSVRTTVPMSGSSSSRGSAK